MEAHGSKTRVANDVFGNIRDISCNESDVSPIDHGVRTVKHNRVLDMPEIGHVLESEAILLQLPLCQIVYGLKSWSTINAINNRMCVAHRVP